MIKRGDKLICTNGNVCYAEGETYTVGEFVNGKYFELMTGCNDEHWYATVDDRGIYVHFNAIENEHSDAWFAQVMQQDCA